MRRRLLWQLLLAIGLLLGGLFLVLDVLVDRAMYRQLDQFLASRGAALAQQLQARDQDLDEILPAYDIVGHTEFFAIYARNGVLLAASMNSARAPLASPPQATVRTFGDTRLPDGHAGRYVVIPLNTGVFAGGQLVMATERESWDATEQRMHGVLLVGTLLASIAAVLLCLLLVRRAFAAMASEAERLRHVGPDSGLTPSTAPSELQPFIRAVHEALRKSWAMTERERRFSRNVAHELRTPVTEIRIASDHALREDDADSLRAGLLLTQRANARMARGIEALLALARHESGQEPPTPDPVELSALLRQQVDAVLQSEGLPSSCIQLDAPADAWVHCDAGMLESIVANLLQNAVEYADAGTPVQVVLQQTTDGYQLQVRNRASQVTPDDLARFGERHWRGQQDGDARHAGLGVALVHAMADAMRLPVAFALDNGEVVATVGPMPAL